MTPTPAALRKDAKYREPLAETVDVIVPVLNEVEMLPRFLERVDALPAGLHLIFVDNGSTDGTLQLLRERSGVTLHEHGKNLGYGCSLVDGLRLSTAPRVVIIDADCEYPPEAIPALLKSLDDAPVVYTSRFCKPPGPDMSPSRKWGNRIVSGVFNLLYRQNITDLYTGMKAMRREAFEGLTLTRRGFEHVVELACGLALRGHRIAEIPVPYSPRQTGRSKMSHVPEALKAFRLLLLYRIRRHG